MGVNSGKRSVKGGRLKYTHQDLKVYFPEPYQIGFKHAYFRLRGQEVIVPKFVFQDQDTCQGWATIWTPNFFRAKDEDQNEYELNASELKALLVEEYKIWKGANHDNHQTK
jgi:hypothetical protein